MSFPRDNGPVKVDMKWLTKTMSSIRSELQTWASFTLKCVEIIINKEYARIPVEISKILADKYENDDYCEVKLI